MSTTVTLELPEDLLPAMREDPASFARELRIAAAVKWYEVGRVSQGKAAEVAGLSRAAFFNALARYGVSPFQESAEDLRQEFGRQEFGRTEPAG
jgi:predicted HTH domain antitoxin